MTELLPETIEAVANRKATKNETETEISLSVLPWLWLTESSVTVGSHLSLFIGCSCRLFLYRDEEILGILKD